MIKTNGFCDNDWFVGRYTWFPPAEIIDITDRLCVNWFIITFYLANIHNVRILYCTQSMV